MKKILLVLFSAIMLFGCSSPQDANEKNFTEALQNYYENKPMNITINFEFPAEIEKSGFKYKRNLEMLSEFEKLGFITSEEFERTVGKGNLFSRAANPDNKIVWIKYSLTEKGKTVTSKLEKSFFSKGGTQFCYGKGYNIQEVSSFTAPADSNGYKISKVTFSVKGKNIEDWVKENSVFKTTYSHVRKNLNSLETPLPATAVLILTNNGWVHEMMMPKG